MAGIQSISTSKFMNRFCIARTEGDNADSVCKKCYATRYTKIYPSLRKCLEVNYEVLHEKLHELCELKKLLDDDIMTSMVRIEAFGDVDCVTQARNYIRIIRLAPLSTFGVWTKNYGVWKNAIELEGKPKNMRLVLSSEEINKPLDHNNFPLADHIFTVYSRDTDKKLINCGARKCFDCRKCYRTGKKNIYINEYLK